MTPADRQVLIEFKEHGSSGKGHLKTNKNPKVKTSDSSQDRQITWTFNVENATRARFWFPSEKDLEAAEKKLFEEGQREIELQSGKGSLTLTVDKSCPDDSYPYTIFCNVKDSKFEQKGHQLVEGPNSHATTDVGP